MADKIVIEKEFESLGIMFPVLFLLWFSCFVCETTLNYGQKRQQKYGNVACAAWFVVPHLLGVKKSLLRTYSTFLNVVL